MTDVHKLQQVLTGEVKGRRCGKTTLMCHEIAAQIELGDFPYIYVVAANKDHAQRLKRQVKYTLNEHGFVVTKETLNEQVLVDSNGVRRTLIYLTPSFDPNKLRGVKHKTAFIDHVAQETIRCYDAFYEVFK